MSGKKTRTIDGLTLNEHDRIKSWFAGHKSSERKSISWHMNSFDKDGRYESNYAYAITWTPGTLCISGDIGEFTVTHYHAMKTIEQTVQWLDHIDFFYLMSKSTGKEVYDEGGTFEDIVNMANEGAINSLKCLHDDRRQYRMDCAEAKGEFERVLAVWRNEQPTDESEPVLASFIPDDGDVMKLEIRERTFSTYGESINRMRHYVPEGWETWYRIWLEVDGSGDPAAIFTTLGRDYLKAELKSHLGDENSAAELCSRLRIDDYYGCWKYPFPCHVWHAAIQAWVALVKPVYMAEASAA